MIREICSALIVEKLFMTNQSKFCNTHGILSLRGLPCAFCKPNKTNHYVRMAKYKSGFHQIPDHAAHMM